MFLTTIIIIIVILILILIIIIGIGAGVIDASDRCIIIFREMFQWFRMSPSQIDPLTRCLNSFFAKFPVLSQKDNAYSPSEQRNFLIDHQKDFSGFIKCIREITDIPVEMIIHIEELIKAFSLLIVRKEVASETRSAAQFKRSHDDAIKGTFIYLRE